MPRVKLTKTVIDALPTPRSDIVYWDAALPGFGVKVTPKGRKVFIVLYRTGGAGGGRRDDKIPARSSHVELKFAALRSGIVADAV